MASRRGRQQGSGSSGAGGQPDGGLREAQNLVQQYSAGKKFRVKYLGSHDIDDYRNKRETSAIMSDLKRRSSKATKPKAVISLSSKELVVMDEKSKTVTMKVPVQKVKFICHDKHDSSLFGVILATDRITSESQRLHRLFCYQSDAKIAMSFVRSINELFQALGAIMRERRRNAENSSSSTGGGGGAGGGASSSGGGASSSSVGGQANRSQNGQPQATQTSAATRGGDPMSDEEERYEPVPLGFGIAPPPPSYKAAISKKNEAIFRKPDVVTTVNTRLPPPPSSSRPKKLAAPLPSGGSPAVAPPIAPPPTSRTRRSIGGAGTPTSTAPVTSQTPPTSVATPTSTTTPTSVATPTSATSLPLPQVPQEASSNRVDGGAMFNVGGGDEEEENSLTATFEGNIYDVPTSNRAADQGQRAAVWQEWQALESELQNIAQDLGFDMDNGSTVPEGFPGGPLPAVEDMRIPSPIVSTAGEMNQSISSNPEDPFADDFFQSSFGSSSVSISMQAAWPESVSSMNQVEDPFGGTSSGFETIWERSDSIGGGVADPFQEGVVTTPTSSGPTDPFQDSDVTPTSAAASFDFSSQSAWSAAAATTTPAEGMAQSSNGFDEGFGSSWGAFDSEISTATTAPVSQSFPPEQASQHDPIFSPPPSQQATTPKRVDTAQAGPRDIFEPESGSTTASAAAPPTTSLPPPLPKRDSMGLIPPPVSPQRRADAKADRNQSTTPSRSRPRPAAVDSTPNAASQVVLNRPAKSRSSPSQSRASSGEVEAQVPTTQHPPPSEFTADLATFESAFPDLETSDISTSTAAAMASDPFQSDFTSQSTAPPPSSSQTTASDPFQDVPLSTSANFPTGAIENEASANVSQLSAGNPFLDSFQDSVSPASVQQQAEPAQESPFKISDGGAVTTSNASEANWSAFGASGSKPQETSKSDWSPFGSTGSASQTASGPAQEPTGWSDFGSQPQTQQPPTSSIASFGDDWSGGGGGASNITSAPQRQSTGTGTVQQTKPSAQAVVPATATSQGKSDSGSWAAFGGGTPTSAPPQPSPAPTASTSAKVGLIAAPPPASKSNRGRDGSVSSRSRPRGRPSTDGALGSQQGLSVALSSQRTPNTGSPGSQPIQNVAKSQPQTTTSNPLNKAEVTTKKSSSYLEDLSSLSAQPQFPTPVAMNYQAGVGPPFPQQQPGGWNGPPPGSQPQQFSQQQQPQLPANFQYGQGVPSQQQQFMQQQQQAMFMQQQQQQMQQGPGQMQPGPGQVGQMQPGPSHMQRGRGQMQPAPGQMQMQPGPGQLQQGPGQMQMQQGPGQMQQGPGQMQQGPGQMQQGPGQMQQGPWQMQSQAGSYPMQQGAVGQQFSPGGQQVMGPPGAGRQMQPPQFSTPQQQQNFYQQQQQFQQNANAFSPVRPQFQQQQNPLTPGNASMGSVGGGSNLSTSNLYTSDFSSPPYAVGSSTPQSGAGSSPSPPPPTVEYRPAVNDGRPDPFAALVTGALTPSKDKKIDSEKLKAAFVKSPPPNQGYPTTTPGPYGNVPSMNPQGWV